MVFCKSSHSVLDECQFGEALILSSFNYKRGEIYEGEFTANYNEGGHPQELRLSRS